MTDFGESLGETVTVEGECPSCRRHYKLKVQNAASTRLEAVCPNCSAPVASPEALRLHLEIARLRQSLGALTSTTAALASGLVAALVMDGVLSEEATKDFLNATEQTADDIASGDAAAAAMIHTITAALRSRVDAANARRRRGRRPLGGSE